MAGINREVMSSRELVIGDVHGCIRALKTLLDLAQPTADDTVIFLGDYVDRGPDSCGVIETILELGGHCTVIALGGNHEKMLLNARQDAQYFKDWLMYGGKQTLASYQRHGYTGRIEDIPSRHWQFFAEETLDYWETEKSIFVHATVDPALNMVDQPEYLLFWERFADPTIHKSGKRIICGHTSQKSGRPAIFDHGICIDTYAYGGGWLTCLDTATLQFRQANEAGQHRAFPITALLE